MFEELRLLRFTVQASQGLAIFDPVVLTIFEEAGQGAGIGDVSGALAVVCVEDLPLLVHHKAAA